MSVPSASLRRAVAAMTLVAAEHDANLILEEGVEVSALLLAEGHSVVDVLALGDGVGGHELDDTEVTQRTELVLLGVDPLLSLRSLHRLRVRRVVAGLEGREHAGVDGAINLCLVHDGVVEACGPLIRHVTPWVPNHAIGHTLRHRASHLHVCVRRREAVQHVLVGHTYEPMVVEDVVMVVGGVSK